MSNFWSSVKFLDSDFGSIDSVDPNDFKGLQIRSSDFPGGTGGALVSGCGDAVGAGSYDPGSHRRDGRPIRCTRLEGTTLSGRVKHVRYPVLG